MKTLSLNKILDLLKQHKVPYIVKEGNITLKPVDMAPQILGYYSVKGADANDFTFSKSFNGGKLHFAHNDNAPLSHLMEHLSSALRIIGKAMGSLSASDTLDSMATKDQDAVKEILVSISRHHAASLQDALDIFNGKVDEDVELDEQDTSVDIMDFISITFEMLDAEVDEATNKAIEGRLMKAVEHDMKLSSAVELFKTMFMSDLYKYHVRGSDDDISSAIRIRLLARQASKMFASSDHPLAKIFSSIGTPSETSETDLPEGLKAFLRANDIDINDVKIVRPNSN